jgi:hypothetical protein
MVELPLNGRDYNQLALLSPGVLTPTPRLQSIGFRGAFNVNGNRAFQNAFQLDGVDNTSYSNSFRGMNVQIVQPSVEAIQEFKIRNAYSAEFGKARGAHQRGDRSGTNQVHGSRTSFMQRQSGCHNFFANRSGLTSPFRKNQFKAQWASRSSGPRSSSATMKAAIAPARSLRLGSLSMWRQAALPCDLESMNPPTRSGLPHSGGAGCNDGSGLLADSGKPDGSVGKE